MTMKRNQIEVYYVILMQLLLWAEVAVNNKRQSVSNNTVLPHYQT